jgi:putative transposase
VQLTAFENAHAERWVRSVKDECLSKIIPFGERSLRRAMKNYLAHYHRARNHAAHEWYPYLVG